MGLNLSKLDNRKILLAHIYTTYLYAFFLPFGIYFSLKILILWVLTALPFFKWSNIKSCRHKYFLLLLLIYVSLFFVGILYSKPREVGFELASKRLLIPLIIAIVMWMIKYYRNKVGLILSLFVLGSVVSALVLWLIATIRSVYIVDGSIFFDPRFDLGYGMGLKRALLNSYTYFTYRNFSYLMHPGYRSMYYVFALGVWIFLKRNPYDFKHNQISKFLTKPIIFYSGVIFLSVTIFLLSSKTNLISWFLLMLLTFLTGRFPYRYIISAVFTVLIAILILQNPRTQELVKAISDYNNAKLISGEDSTNLARIYFWESSIKIGMKSPIIGVGTADLEWQLMRDNARRGLYQFVSPVFNAHNEFIDTFARLGIIGLISLLSWLGYIFYYGVKERRQLLLFLLVLLLINMSFEVIFNREVGIVFAMFFIGLLLLTDYEQKLPKIFFSGV